MSVVPSLNEGAEAELLQAQREHEPSMEEILASIRAIISDDPPAPKPGPQIVYSSDEPVAPVPSLAWAKEEPTAPSPAAEPPPPEAEAEEEPLTSEETEDSVAASFQSLAESMASHGREVAEKITREMLRPMLKEWIDANLPPLVERLVRAEIQRMARGRR